MNKQVLECAQLPEKIKLIHENKKKINTYSLNLTSQLNLCKTLTKRIDTEKAQLTNTQQLEKKAKIHYQKQHDELQELNKQLTSQIDEISN